MILMEILCYALVGAFLGMGLGILLGKGAVQAVCQTVSGIYFPLTVSQTHVTLSVLIKGMMAGTLSAVAAIATPRTGGDKVSTGDPGSEIRFGSADAAAGSPVGSDGWGFTRLGIHYFYHTPHRCRD